MDGKSALCRSAALRDDEDLPVLAKRFIDDANIISGDLVLRASKRGRNASELMGVVLSRYLIQRELGQSRYFGWYFLDDYADWLGQKEEHIADILALSPEEDESGNTRLAVIISESKYIDHASLAVKRKESQKQLRQTIDRIGKALFGDPGRLDRDIWLSRFSDMVLNGINFAANAPLDLSQLRRAIREGDCAIYLRGYSHVFVSGPTDCPDCSDFSQVAECDGSFQEVFSRANPHIILCSAKSFLRRLFKIYYRFFVITPNATAVKIHSSRIIHCRYVPLGGCFFKQFQRHFIYLPVTYLIVQQAHACFP